MQVIAFKGGYVSWELPSLYHSQVLSAVIARIETRRHGVQVGRGLVTVDRELRPDNDFIRGGRQAEVHSAGLIRSEGFRQV